MSIYKKFTRAELNSDTFVDALNERFQQIEDYLMKRDSDLSKRIKDINSNLANINRTIDTINNRLDSMDNSISSNSAMLKLILQGLQKMSGLILSEKTNPKKRK